MEETWRDVVGFEGYYQVSNLGKVRSVDRVITERNSRRRRNLKGKEINLALVGKERKQWGFTLKRGKYKKSRPVHRVVAEAFLGQRPKGYQVNHINGDFLDNRASNLEYTTPQYNTAHYHIQTRPTYGFTYRDRKNGKPYQANIKIANFGYSLGYFSTPKEAQECYAEFCREFYGLEPKLKPWREYDTEKRIEARNYPSRSQARNCSIGRS